MPRSKTFPLALLLLAALAGPSAAQEPRRPLHDLGHAGTSFLRDGWALISFPSRLDGDGWRKVGVVAGVGGVLLAFDEEITDAIRRSREDQPLDLLGDVGDELEPLGLMGNTNAALAGGAVLGYALNARRVQRACQELLYAQLLGGAVRNGAKLVLGRRRPNEGQGAYLFELSGGTSLPSGHTSTIFAAAEVLSHHVGWRPATVLFYALASTVGYQRVESRSHWASDVWIGAVTGVAAAKLVIRLHEEENGGQLTPVLDASTGTAGLAFTRRF